jgi:CHASE2 domain-containing sensor protein/predicted Ser/Thr protein kinase
MIGTLLGSRYKVINILSGGGFGQTYVAIDTQRPGSPKCVVKHLKPLRQNPAFLEMARRLFQTEADILEKLGRHDQIPHLLAYFEENKQFYLVQQFIEGHPLSDELSGRTRLTEEQVIAILRDVLNTLKFVHRHQVIHRDIKPGNLVRRHRDSKIVLIDFGAVKEIGNQLGGNTNHTGVTIGIGTHGYVPSEQLAGKPRYSSDIYALGMTAIQALTGRRPSELEETSDTSEFIWRQYAEVSDGLADILDKMVRYHFRERYQSATEVLQALRQLTGTSDIPTSSSSYSAARSRKSFISTGLFRAIASLALTGVVLGVRQFGGLEPLELSAFDQMIRLRYATRVLGDLDRNKPLEGQDPRLLIVAITEADIKSQKQWPPSDRLVNQLLGQLERHQPRAIGLDIYRDAPRSPGYEELAARIKKSDRIIPVCKVSEAGSPGTPPPKGVPESRVGFNNIAVDPGGIVRRALLFVDSTTNSTESRCTTPYSFSFQLARLYLKKEGIQPQPTPEDYLQLGSAVFKPLKPSFGGYQQADAGGYQILLDYHSAHNIAQQVTLRQVLNGQFDPSLVKDKIVLIGVTAPSNKDSYYTPYSEGRPMTGALLHAQMVSQILSVVLDKRPLIWFWSEEAEMLWIAGWGLASSIMIGRTRHPLLLIVSVGTMLGVLVGASFWLFIQDAWVPVAAPALALVITSAAVVASRLRQPPQRFTAISSETPANSTTDRQLTLATVLEDSFPTETVSFESSSTKITVHGSLEPNQRQPYSLSCSQGQMLTIQATEGNISITVVAPGRQAVGMVTGTNAQWQGLLPTSGNYIIEVSTVVASKYTINFNLTNQNSSVSEIITTVIPSQANDNSSSVETKETKIAPENVTKKYEM